jgi:hypothetical protein
LSPKYPCSGSRNPCGAHPPRNTTLSCTSPDYREAACEALAGGQPGGSGGSGAGACAQVYWPLNQLTQVRELQAVSTPWMLGAFAAEPPVTVLKFAKAWRALEDAGGFDAQWGPRTAERRHPCYNYTRWHPVVGPGG